MSTIEKFATAILMAALALTMTTIASLSASQLKVARTAQQAIADALYPPAADLVFPAAVGRSHI